MNERRVFFAKRQDGLGERLRAIVNAFALAQLYGGEFRFYWDDRRASNEYHVTKRVEDIFSSDFIQKYHVDPDDVGGEMVPVASFLQKGGGGCFYCDQLVPEGLFGDRKDEYVEFREKVENAFWEIEFSEPAMDAILLARRVKLGGKVFALHLRAGDVVYGKYKPSLNVVGKAISYPVANELVERAVSQGFEVIVFGQDPTVMRKLEVCSSVKLASDFVPEALGEVGAAFFDIVLMSRCLRVCAGGSGFAVLSSLIGPAKLLRVGELVDDQRAVKLILSYLRTVGGNSSGISSEQLVFAIKTALVLGVRCLDYRDIDYLAKFGLELDPTNGLFHFVYAWCCFEQGLSRDGVVALSSLLESGDMYEDFYRLNLNTPHSRRIFRKVFDCSKIESHAGRFGSKNMCFFGS